MNGQNHVPAVDRTIAVLGVLEKHREGLTLPEIAAGIEVPRTTVYRILNSLEAANFIRRAPRTGRYALGLRLLELATSVRRGFHPLDLAALARPHLERLRAAAGEASKLSVLDGEFALVLDAVVGSSEYSIVPTVGHRFARGEKVRVKDVEGAGFDRLAEPVEEVEVLAGRDRGQDGIRDPFVAVDVEQRQWVLQPGEAVRLEAPGEADPAPRC